jgi:hypothetical protein
MRLLLAGIVIAIGCTAPPPPVTPASAPVPAPRPVSAGEPSGLPAGYVEVKADRVVALGDQGALLLVDEADNLVLPVFIGGTEAASIDTRLRSAKPVRPMPSRWRSATAFRSTSPARSSTRPASSGTSSSASSSRPRPPAAPAS